MTEPFESFHWVSLEGWKSRWGRRWLLIEYRQSLAAPLMRPVIRILTRKGALYRFAQAPLFGKGSAIIMIPRGTLAIDIGHGPEPEWKPRVTRVRHVFLASLLIRALRRNPRLAIETFGASLIHADREQEQALGFARGGIPLAEYNHWRANNWRDPDGEDFFPPNGAVAHLIAPEFSSQEQTRRLIDHLATQHPTFWHLHVPPDAVLEHPSVSSWSEGATLGDLLNQMAPSALALRVGPSTELPPLALAMVLDGARRNPDLAVLYGDEECRAANGVYHSPCLKPDWSPDFEATGGYLGQAVFWRAAALETVSNRPIGDFDMASCRSKALAGLKISQVGHLRRMLMTHWRDVPWPLPEPSPEPAIPDRETSALEVSLVIASKNRLSLIKPCIESLLALTAHNGFEIILVDNGSSDTDVLEYYETLRNNPRIHIVEAPGPFNFARLSNLGARKAQGRWLVFLNNDIEIVRSDWLERLRRLVLRPDVGAVGARLLFPDGSLQHAGVVVGMGGFADHLHIGAPGESLGYLARLATGHEVAAVTGACLAVESARFHAVGGFDEENYPVELNDIDLCLRLAERGWKTMMAPQAVLVHHQSASRGRALLPFSRYARERDAFSKRWAHVVRDDPWYHPALSRNSCEPELDG